jgi:hypothetical protein
MRASRVALLTCSVCWLSNTTLYTRYIWLLTMNWSVSRRARPLCCYLPVDGGGGGVAGCGGVAKVYTYYVTFCYCHSLIGWAPGLQIESSNELRRYIVLLNSSCSQSFFYYLNLTLRRHYLYITGSVVVHRSSCHYLCFTVILSFTDHFKVPVKQI